MIYEARKHTIPNKIPGKLNSMILTERPIATSKRTAINNTKYKVLSYAHIGPIWIVKHSFIRYRTIKVINKHKIKL